MLLPQFRLKTLLWFIAVVANVFTGWEIIDLCGAAMQTGEFPYLTADVCVASASSTSGVLRYLWRSAALHSAAAGFAPVER